MKYSLASLLWVVLYVAVIAAVVGGLVQARRGVMETYGSAEAQTEWDAWREDARAMAEGSGPVRRRAPKSAEPPALVLMRDHFPTCVALSVLLTTVLFGTFMVFIRGALATKS